METPGTSGRGLRIAQLANFVGPVSGGMRRAIDMLGEGYVAAGAERILIIPGEKDAVTQTPGGSIIEIKSPHISQVYRMILDPFRVMKVLKEFGPTSIESSDKWTLAWIGRWAKRNDVGSVLFSHERLDGMMSSFFQRQFGVAELTGAMNRRLSKEYDAVVVTSRYAADEFAHTGANLVMCPLGVDLETFHPGAGRPPTDGVLHTIYAGRLSREKYPQLGIRTALELHSRGVPVHHHVYGTGPHVKWLREIAGDGPITFHGYVDGRDAVAAALASADICLSVCPVETFGLQTLEALACGTPVVTANRGGAFELIDASCGDWDDPNPLALADAVERLAECLHAGSADETRHAARRRAELYPWSKPIDVMVDVHRRLARKERP